MTGILKVDQWKDSGDNALMTSDGAGNLTANVSIAGFSSTGIDDNATSTAITIDSSENVGIGTSSPDGSSFSASSSPVLDVSGTRPLIILSETDSNTKKAWLGLSSDQFFVGGTNTNTLFYTGNAERMRIAGAEVYIGGTSKNEEGALTVEPDASWGSPTLQLNRPTGTETSQAVIFYNGGTDVGSIDYDHSGVAYTSTSDYRVKENVSDLSNATERVKQLQPKRFNFISDANKTIDGFLAHEVSDVVPEAVRGTKDEVDEEGNPKYQGIDQSKLVPLLTASLKEAIAKIEELETRIATLENA